MMMMTYKRGGFIAKVFTNKGIESSKDYVVRYYHVDGKGIDVQDYADTMLGACTAANYTIQKLFR